MQLRPDLGGDSEVATAAADRPEEVGLLVLVGVDDAAVGEHELGPEDVVDREAVAARQVADPAAEHQTAGSGRADEPYGRGQSVLAGGRVDLAEQAAARDGGGSRVGVDLDALQP